MQPETPASALQRAIGRLDAICREINAPPAGALPALILVGVLIFGHPAIPEGAAATAAACDHSQAAPQAAGPHSRDLLCMGRSLQEAADANGEAKAKANAEGGR